MNARQTMEAAILQMVCVSTPQVAIIVRVNRDTICRRIANSSVKVRSRTDQLRRRFESIGRFDYEYEIEYEYDFRFSNQ